MSKPLITTRESSRYPGYFVKKYSKRVFFDGLWGEHADLIEARGHVVNANGTTVINPFTKIFNRGEQDTDIDRDEPCVAVRKVNGFMAAATYVPAIGHVVVSTTGSLDSPFVAIADRHLTKDIRDLIEAAYFDYGMLCTFMFEIVDPEDPHIIPETAGAYLIGVREVSDTEPYKSSVEMETTLDALARASGAMRPEWFQGRFSDIVQAAKQCQHEGFCVYGLESGTALKIKSPYYLALKAAARKADIEKMNKQWVDEEFYPLIDHLLENKEMFNSLDEQSRLQYMRDFLVNQ